MLGALIDINTMNLMEYLTRGIVAGDFRSTEAVHQTWIDSGPEGTCVVTCILLCDHPRMKKYTSMF